MKLMYLVVILAAMVFSCVSQKDQAQLNSQAFQADSTVVRFLGNRTLASIAKPDSVVAYLIKGQDSTAKSIAGYKAEKYLGKADRSLYGILQFWITDGNSYRWKMQNKCIISPTAAFVFWQQGKPTTVLLDEHCEKWEFVQDTTRRQSEITHSPMVAKYLRALK